MKESVTSFLSNILSVILGIFITFTIQGMIDRSKEKKETRSSLELVRSELVTNMDDISIMADYLHQEKASAEYILSNKDSLDSCPEDSVNYHSSMIFADTLDRLVHVHGTMGSGIVLGVNDESQIANEAWQSDYTAQRLLIKENIDDILGQARIKTAEKMIDQSRIVCVYGMSLSATDRNWWNYIYRWLMSNSDRRLLLFAYDEKNSNRVTAYRTFMNMYSTQNRFKEIIDIPDREWESVKNRIFARSSSGMFSVASIEGETSGSEA